LVLDRGAVNQAELNEKSSNFRPLSRCTGGVSMSSLMSTPFVVE
jgi:hypothetical protein